MTFEAFSHIVDEEMELLPDYVFEDLNGGVVVDESAYLHPARVADDLYILGTYTSDRILGRQVRLYYGSFIATIGHQEEALRRQIRDTLRHEFLHHLETKAGIIGRHSLGEKDRQKMVRYFESHGMTGGSA